MDLPDITHLKYRLFLKRRFLPIFIAQFFGSFNDNMLRNGLVVLIAYASNHGIDLPVEKPAVLVTMCAALLVMPFIIFSSVAGQLADKIEKARLVTYTKIAEILIMSVAYWGFYTHNIYLLMVMLFISGTHSTFFGPIKYSILPEHLHHKELLAGNGFISAGTYMGVLLGLIAGALLVEVSAHAIGLSLLGVAIIGFIASLLIPHTKPAAPETHVHFRLWSGTREIIAFARRSSTVFTAILGLSWFLLTGSVYMSQFANYAKEVVHADGQVYTMFLTIFSIGIALGAVLADVLLKGQISTRYAPLALLGVSFFTTIIVFTSPIPTTGQELTSVTEFLSHPQHWLIMVAMLMVAVCGGIYMVPLYAILQTGTEDAYRSRVIAASNLFDSLFMTIAAIVCAILLMLGVSITGLFLVLATLNLGVCYYAKKSLAQSASAAS